MLRGMIQEMKVPRGQIGREGAEQENSRHESVAVEVVRPVYSTTPAALIAGA